MDFFLKLFILFSHMCLIKKSGDKCYRLMCFAHSETPSEDMILCVFSLLLVALIMFYLLMGIYYVHLVPQKLYVLSFYVCLGCIFSSVQCVNEKRHTHEHYLYLMAENMSMVTFCDPMHVKVVRKQHVDK